MWNARYDREDYLFGTEPSVFLRRHAELLEPGASVLAVADGEGRNSVYLAGRGHHVTAFDASHVGIAKARKLATQRGVTVPIMSRGVSRVHAKIRPEPQGYVLYDLKSGTGTFAGFELTSQGETDIAVLELPAR